MELAEQRKNVSIDRVVSCHMKGVYGPAVCFGHLSGLEAFKVRNGPRHNFSEGDESSGPDALGSIGH